MASKKEKDLKENSDVDESSDEEVEESDKFLSKKDGDEIEMAEFKKSPKRELDDVNKEEKDDEVKETLLGAETGETNVLNNIEENIQNAEDQQEPGVEENPAENVERPNRRFFPSSRHRRRYFVFAAVIGGIFILMAIIFACLTRLEYDQLGLKRNKLTGSVDTDSPYDSGMHFNLPWYEFIVFDKTVHQIKSEQMRILTRDKLEVRVSIIVAYFVNKTDLGVLFRKYATEYVQVTKRIVNSCLLNEGQRFTIAEYRANRSQISTHFRKVLKDLLDRNHMRLLDVYIGKIQFAREINDLNLLRVIVDIKTETVSYEKQASIIRKSTDHMVKTQLNKAHFIIENATSSAKYGVVEPAKIDKNYRIEFQHLRGLNKSTNELNINGAKQKLSYCYLSMLGSHPNLVINQRNNENFGFYVRSAPK